MAEDNSLKSLLKKTRAWSVHLYTSLGLALSLLAVNAITNQQASWAVIYMVIAMFIDGTDGNLARRWQVKKWTPTFDGRKLDDIVDYLTYTFIPIFFAYQFQIVTGGWVAVLFIVLLASAYGFCNESAKTDDGFFTGFPSYWNAVILYLYWLSWPQWLAAWVMLIFAALTFFPLKYISLNQTNHLRKINLLLFLLWCVVLLIIVADFEQPNRLLVHLSLIYPAFYFLASGFLYFGKNR